MSNMDWLFDNSHINYDIIHKIAKEANLTDYTFSILSGNKYNPALLIYKINKENYYVINLNTLQPDNLSICKTPLSQDIINLMKSVNINNLGD